MLLASLAIKINGDIFTSPHTSYVGKLWNYLFLHIFYQVYTLEV